MAGSPGFLIISKGETGAVSEVAEVWDEEAEAGKDEHRWEGPLRHRPCPASPGRVHGGSSGAVDRAGP